jgi:hypothetical protein
VEKSTAPLFIANTIMNRFIARLSVVSHGVPRPIRQAGRRLVRER